ncbi:potassium-transporting ATPase subunit C [Kibdelosporangium phytohabitans]|uniref:Potassium-transporting ATPase KdpC subunit n=1 Tax=Kibdelosporangium phytohabitans TaxID=860235 RepID=A0A0N9I310_9PSEU|nr:potassium-transporting ATPase subunit C [Kibdelosporangium phytohabitans]ALG13075.1 K+-transporting ATPase subunit C [Kibdelosporangium phytohabitans]MBE1464813.1 K+-transporting ATPase ATPase C chain [Kibdelosporangium phytohabitans]
MLKQIWAGFRILIVLTVITGVVYPLGVWVVSRVPGLESNAEGSIVTQNGQNVGSDLIGVDPVAQDPDNDPWFHTRPSALAEDPLGPADPSSSGASNKGAANEDYLKVVQERKDKIAQREGVDPSTVPADAVTASGSGLDPQISPAYAQLQAPRVARVTGVPLAKIQALISENTTRGIAEPGVDVLKLNLAVQATKRG